MKITKLLAGTLAGVITTSAIFMGATPVVSFADEKYVVCTCEGKCTESEVNETCEVCNYDFNLCEGDAVAVEVREEAVEPVEKFGPLTPEGNLELVDDYGSLEAGGKQFITVVTKSGNFFYIIIDRDDKGNESVHFLNKVDESDLLKLMDDEEVEAYTAMKEAEAETAAAEAEKEIVIIEDEPVPGSTGNIAKVPETKTETTEPDPAVIVGTVLIVALMAFGGILVFCLKKMKNKPKKGIKDDDDSWDIDDDDEDDDDDVLSRIPVDRDVVPEPDKKAGSNVVDPDGEANDEPGDDLDWDVD